MTTPGQASERLWSFLWGKRHWRRHAVSIRVDVSTRQRRFRGATVDLSAGGALLRVPTKALAGTHAGPGGALVGMQESLSEPFRLRFREEKVDARATLVRASWKPGEEDLTYLGCRFPAPLSGEQLRRLGLTPDECGPEVGVQTVPADLMRLQADPDSPVELEVDVGDTLDAVPAYEGVVRGMDGRALATELSGSDPTEVVARLGGHAFGLRARSPEGAILWSDRAYLLGVRLLDEEKSGVEVVVLANSLPPREVRRRMSPRRVPGSPEPRLVAPVSGRSRRTT